MNPLLLLLAISNRNDISTTVLTIYSQFITRRYTHIHIIPSNIVLRSNRTSIDTKRHYLEKEQFIEPFIIVMPFQIQGGSRCESSSQLGRKDLSWIGNGETTRCFHEARISRCKNCQARYPLTKPKCKRMGARTKKFPLKYRPERQLFSELVLTTRSLFFFSFPLHLINHDPHDQFIDQSRKLPRSFRRCNTTSWWFRLRTGVSRRFPRQ